MATKKTTSPAKKTSSRTARKTTKEAPAAEKAMSAKKTSPAKKTSGAKKTSAVTKTSPAESSRKSTNAPRSARRPAASASSGDGAASSGKKLSAGSVAAGAARQLLQLTGREVEGVTGLEKTDDGWRVQVEVLEVRRIPDTTDVLAIYEIDVDSDGELVGYHRVTRYVRGAPREG